MDSIPGPEDSSLVYRRVKEPKEVIVIFQLHMREGADEAEYRRTSLRMHDLVDRMPGFISLKEYTGEDGEVIDLARFEDEKSLQAWKHEPEHLEAQRKGREEFYDHYRIQACRVIRDYEFTLDGEGKAPTMTQHRGKPQGLSGR